MNIWQNIIVLTLGIVACSSFLIGLKNRKNPFGLCKIFNPLGAFVWVDAVIFGLFFTLVSVFCLIIQEWTLFLVVFFVFWTVRSTGEQIYWFLEQFAQKHRNPPHTLWPYKFFKGEEVWIVMQIFWQCVSVISITILIYLLISMLKS